MDPKAFLETKGFLTIHALESYLKMYHPLRSVTYPTLRRYVAKGYFGEPLILGGQTRLMKEHIDRYVERGTAPPKVDTKTALFDTEGGRSGPLPSITKEPMPPVRIDPRDDYDPDADVDPEPPSTLIVPAIPKRQPVRPNVPLPPEDDDDE